MRGTSKNIVHFKRVSTLIKPYFRIKQHLVNIPGWRTNRKIVVFESDDWGSVRMPSKKVYEKLLSKGLRVDLCPYNRYDTLETSEDFEELYVVLKKYKDIKSNHPIITTNVNTVNPDFEKIRENKFEGYFYEKFTDSLKNYYPNENVFKVWKEGIDSKFIYPQYHSREHINPHLWLELLNKGNAALLNAFDLNVYGLSFATSNQIKVPYLASLIYRNAFEFEQISKAIQEGFSLFENIFNFKSKSFIAPLNTWNTALETQMKKAGIEYIQGGNVHKTYDFTNNKFNKVFHSFGSTNKYNQIYLNRNCIFEPSILGKRFDLNKVLKEIEIAFLWNKPAVICTHRLNFMGKLDVDNRNNTLKSLDRLLSITMKKWPNVEFIHSSQLGDIIKGKK